MRLTDMAQQWLAEVLEDGDVVVDATLGNGFDALFLAQHISDKGHLFAFDVQEQAIYTSTERLQNTVCFKHLNCISHALMAEYIPEQYLGHIKVIMFNLGWLPNSDKSIITKPETTLAALKQSLTYLADGGRMSVMVYPGHHGGDDEAFHVIQWLENTCQQSPQTLHFEKIEVAHRPKAPLLLKISKASLYSGS